MVPALREAADKAGLGERYEIANCGAEDKQQLRSLGIKQESVDCIISIQVLCSVQDPKTVIADLYKLLKPGGELIVYEHMRSLDVLDRVVQSESSNTLRCAALRYAKLR